MVCAPGQRFHPAIVAQAIATLGEMFPGRYSIELGSGEALNETITGTSWPAKNIRNERLKESVDVIRKLLRGEKVTYHGLINVKEAKLYTIPQVQPRLMCAAISKETSAWCGEWADGLLTTAGDNDELLEKKRGFEKNGGAGKDVIAQFSFSFASTKEEAVEGAWHQWRSNLLDPGKLAGLHTPQQFDEISKDITRDEVAEKIKVYTDVAEVFEKAYSYLDQGISMVTLHNVNTNQEEFVEACGRFLASDPRKKSVK